MLPVFVTIARAGAGRPCRRCPSCRASGPRKAAPPSPMRGRERARTGLWAPRSDAREVGARRTRPSPRGSLLRSRSRSRPAAPGSSSTRAAPPNASLVLTFESQYRARPIFRAMAASSALGGVVKRREDPRLVTGAGQYTDDVHPVGCLHAVFVRSPHAYARIAAVDVSDAQAMPGVVGIFQAADLTFASETARPRLCSEEVKFVGDAVAVAVAANRGEAVDAAAAVIVDYEVLPALVDSMAALRPDAVLIHPDNGDN